MTKPNIASNANRNASFWLSLDQKKKKTEKIFITERKEKKSENFL